MAMYLLISNAVKLLFVDFRNFAKIHFNGNVWDEPVSTVCIGRWLSLLFPPGQGYRLVLCPNRHGYWHAVNYKVMKSSIKMMDLLPIAGYESFFWTENTATSRFWDRCGW